MAISLSQIMKTKKVQKFDSQGKFITTWNMGDDIGAKGTPEGIAVDSEGRVYISDYAAGRMQVFSNDGEMLWAWGNQNLASGHFSRPTSITFDNNGRIYIVNQSGNSVDVYQLP